MAAPSVKPTSRPATSGLDVPLAPLKARAAGIRPVRTGHSTLLDRIRAEFLEMRGFSPTLKQAERLFYLPEDVCRDVLGTLVTEGFLQVERDGRFRLSRPT